MPGGTRPSPSIDLRMKSRASSAQHPYRPERQALRGQICTESESEPKGDPLFASDNDPHAGPERHGSEGIWAVMGNGLLERLERREGVARPEFQPLQQQILFPAGRGVSCGF